MGAADHLRALFAELGFPEDPEQASTPERVAELWASFVPGPLRKPSISASSSDGPVVVAGIPFHSMCAHHLLPFFGTVAVGYRPNGALLGLGSIPALVAQLARRPQLQERLGEQIAEALDGWVAPKAVVVGIRARHLCVEMRGAAVSADVRTLASRGAVDAWLTEQVSR